MARKAKCPECPKKGAPLWMVTYSDMVTLLLCFFVMLLAMASWDETIKIQLVLDSIRWALGSGGMMEDQTGLARPAGQVPETRDERIDNVVEILESRLQESLAEQISSHMVKMTVDQTEIRIQLNEHLLFAPGSTRLHPMAFGVLTDVAETLQDQPIQIDVEGHSDGTGDWKRNWALSSLRAVSVVTALQDPGGLEGEVLEARGLGEYHPAEPGVQVSDWNRRVELIIRADEPAAYESFRQLEEQ